MLVHEFLQNSAARFPDKTALIFGEQRLTYRTVDEMASRLANAFLAHGLQRGDRVAIYLNNSVETVVAIFATLKAGGTFVVVNHSTKRDKLAYILRNSGAWGLVLNGRKQKLAHWLAAQGVSLNMVVFCGSQPAALPPGGMLFNQIQETFGGKRPFVPTIDRDLACLIYTSGSTGDPKGVMSDHSNVVFAADSIITYLENVPNDIVINVLPLSFDYGLYQLLMTFRFGGTLV
ncbi:MAG: AMP-binding protein, partial [Anaerolineales bacterium]|nr:AMP-binding protein [Anaerolineales bacterium]